MSRKDPTSAANPTPRSARRPALSRFIDRPIGRVIIGFFSFCLFTALFIFLYYYHHYATLVEDKLARGPYSNTSKLFGAPQVVSIGDETTPDEIINSLHRAGYGEKRDNRMGWFHKREDGLEVFPGVDSYFQQEAHVVRFEGKKVAQIISLRDNTERTQFWLEPELVTNLFDRNREKRRIVRFQDIPDVLKNAVLSAEDKRFFMHSGFDPIRIARSAYVDIRSGKNVQGASTLSMQLARELLLSKERSWRRKLPEILITMHLERQLTKEEIFEGYSNQIYIGRVGSFNIHGFGEGAQAYFGKDIRNLNLAEAATLAGIVNGPSIYNPFRNPEKTKNRRNIVLSMMKENGFITPKQYEDASSADLGITAGNTESEDAPYFVDLINEQLQNQFQDHDFQSNTYRVYTTLDSNLQKAAAESIKIAVKEVDKVMERRGHTKEKGWPEVQVALIAIDPYTAEVKALVGGRDYGASQLNRVMSKRQPGSIFKAFVYAAALASGLDGGPASVTPASTVIDEPTTFWYDGKPYEPNNHHSEFFGPVTLRQALQKSLNIPAVKFAEQIGYGHVATLAKKVGLTNVVATPAIALGSYDARPIDMAGAYTVFSNKGVYVQPNYIKMIRNQEGQPIFTYKPVTRRVLDPRVAYMMTNLMEGVMTYGTGAGARGRGFSQPAAGKTGTSRDGWFAGYTTELLTVVWVGYDDNRDIELEGARSALPIWTEFMKRAHKFRPYRRAAPFSAPDGVISVEIDSATGKLAAGCGTARPEVFLLGTQPLETCNGMAATQVAAWDATAPADPASGASASGDDAKRVASRRVNSIPIDPQQVPTQQPGEPRPQRKGFFGRILEVFK